MDPNTTLKQREILVHDMCLRDGMHAKRHQLTLDEMKTLVYTAAADSLSANATEASALQKHGRQSCYSGRATGRALRAPGGSSAYARRLSPAGAELLVLLCGAATRGHRGVRRRVRHR